VGKGELLASCISLVVTDFSLTTVPGPLHHPFAALLPLTSVAPAPASAALIHSLQAFRRAVVPNPTKKTLWRDESGYQGAGPWESVARRGWEESSWCGRRDPGRVCSAAVSLSFRNPVGRVLGTSFMSSASRPLHGGEYLPSPSPRPELTRHAGVTTSAESRRTTPQRR
jgi:hypothetical protein